jgi:hypothetical protein
VHQARIALYLQASKIFILTNKIQLGHMQLMLEVVGSVQLTTSAQEDTCTGFEIASFHWQGICFGVNV